MSAFLFQGALVILTTIRRVKCILAGIYCLLMVSLKILYCDNPLAGMILGKFILKQQMPQEVRFLLGLWLSRFRQHIRFPIHEATS